MKHLLQFIEFQRISIFNFEKKIGVRSTIDKAIKSNSNLRSDILSKIIEQFPEINPAWLVTGKGEMLKRKLDVIQEPAEDYILNSDLKEKIIKLQDEKILLLEEKLEQCLDEKKMTTYNKTTS
jgi:hypothetical protein